MFLVLKPKNATAVALSARGIKARRAKAMILIGKQNEEAKQ